MAERPSGTVTFLFTDIEQSTRLLAELGVEVYAHALEEHRDRLRGALEMGHEVDARAIRSSTPSIAATPPSRLPPPASVLCRPRRSAAGRSPTPDSPRATAVATSP